MTTEDEELAISRAAAEAFAAGGVVFQPATGRRKKVLEAAWNRARNRGDANNGESSPPPQQPGTGA